MNKLTQETKSKLLKQKISVTQAITLNRKTMKNGGKVPHLFWGTEVFLHLSSKWCPEIRKSKSDISQEQELKTCTTMQFPY